MNIVIDAFGGDNAPLEVIKGACDAQRDFNIDITLVGNEEKIKKCAEENSIDITSLKISMPIPLSTYAKSLPTL